MRDARREVIDVWLIWLMIGAVFGVVTMILMEVGGE